MESKNTNTLANINYISSIDGLYVNDINAIQKITPNTSTFTIQSGLDGTIYVSTSEISMPSRVNTACNDLGDISIYDNNRIYHINDFARHDDQNDINVLFKCIVSETSGNWDETAWVRANILDEISISNTSLMNIDASVKVENNKVGNFDLFDSSTVYYENQYVEYDGYYWRCIVTQFQGEWNPAAWRKTSLLDEIKDIRGVQTNVETLTVQVSVNRGEGQVADTSITIIYDAGTGKQPETIRLDNTGKVTFFLDYGDRYYLECSGIAGYTTPTSAIYVAGIPKRTIQMQYRMLGTGVFIIDNNGIEYDVELWDPANNANARFVKYTNSQLNPGGEGQADNSIIISKNWKNYQTNAYWQIEYRDIPSLVNKQLVLLAESDYNGWQNCQLAYTDCITPNAAGKTFVDLYNEEKGMSITISKYLQAIYYSINITEIFMGRNIYGYLPSMGQLKQIANNISNINDGLSKIESNTLNIASGRWPSSTEYDKYIAWHLLNNISTFENMFKVNGWNILPIFSFN